MYIAYSLYVLHSRVPQMAGKRNSNFVKVLHIILEYL